jgi:cell division protein FtsW
MASVLTRARPNMEMHATVRSGLAVGWEAPALLLITITLLSFGLVSVYSASAVMAQSAGQPDYYYVLSQLTGGAMGLVALVIMAQVDYRHLRLLAWPLLIAVILMLIIVIVPGTEVIAPRINGARRWLRLGFMTVQPSEFAKLALIIWTAALAVKKQDKMPSLSRGLLPFLLVWALVEGLIFLEPSFSAGAIALLLALLVVFAAGARIGHFILLGFVGLPVLLKQIGDGYRGGRVTTWIEMLMNKTFDPSGAGYQIHQALIAIGSGGPFGRGFGRGVQKFHYLPEPHNDFLFAMIGEEWGFVGVFLLIALFSAFALIGYRIARQAPDFFGFLLAVGITNLIAVQAVLHMAVNLALIPTTGVTLPFMSYGRSSLIVCLAATGILLNIARRSEGRAE